MSPSSALIAGVGTLMLAMGVGVLIGRSAPSSTVRSAAPVQVLTVPNTGTAAGVVSPESTQSPSSTTATKSSSSAKGSKAAVKSSSTKSLPPAKVVTVGSPGKGPGYQKGHFTGNFFGEGEE
jgi:hypothetical protein